MLNPMRFRLTPDQLAAALSIAGLEPGSRSTLPLKTPPHDPAAALRDTELLEEDGRLTEAATGALRIAADPVHTVAITTNRAGQNNWTAALLLRRDEDDTFVMQTGTGDSGFDFAIVPDLTQATVLVDELLDLTSYGPGSSSPPSTSISSRSPPCSPPPMRRRKPAWPGDRVETSRPNRPT